MSPPSSESVPTGSSTIWEHKMRQLRLASNSPKGTEVNASRTSHSIGSENASNSMKNDSKILEIHHRSARSYADSDNDQPIPHSHNITAHRFLVASLTNSEQKVTDEETQRVAEKQPHSNEPKKFGRQIKEKQLLGISVTKPAVEHNKNTHVDELKTTMEVKQNAESESFETTYPKETNDHLGKEETQRVAEKQPHNIEPKKFGRQIKEKQLVETNQTPPVRSQPLKKGYKSGREKYDYQRKAEYHTNHTNRPIPHKYHTNRPFETGKVSKCFRQPSYATLLKDGKLLPDERKMKELNDKLRDFSMGLNVEYKETPLPIPQATPTCTAIPKLPPNTAYIFSTKTTIDENGVELKEETTSVYQITGDSIVMVDYDDDVMN